MKTPKVKYAIEYKFPNFQIKTLEALATAVQLKRAIVTKGVFDFRPQGYLPATWVFNMNAQMIYRWMRHGMFIHQRKDEPLALSTSV